MKQLNSHILLYYAILFIAYWVEVLQAIAQVVIAQAFTTEVILEIVRTVGVLIAIVLTAWVNYRFGVLHKLINSRMDELLIVTKAKGKAEGIVEGKAIQKDIQVDQIIQREQGEK